MQELLEDSFFIHWGDVTIGTSGRESGNRGRDWNVGQNFGGFHKGGHPTEHDGGVGMFGKVSFDMLEQSASNFVTRDCGVRL